jgi:hypothetical protein
MVFLILIFFINQNYFKLHLQNKYQLKDHLTLSFIKPSKKKSIGVRSGDLSHR